MFSAIEFRARDAMRRGVVGLVGGVFVAIGMGFLTHAVWLALAAFRDPLFAAQVVGGVYVLIGGILLLQSRRRRVVVPPSAPSQPMTHLMLAEAFLVGVDAARAARGTKSRAD